MKESPPLDDILDHLDATAFIELNSLIFLITNNNDTRYSNRWVIEEAFFEVERAHRHTVIPCPGKYSFTRT